MKVNRWNYKTHSYDEFEIDTDFFKVGIWFNNINEEINCVCCKRPVRYGDTYTSLEWHDNIGFGYCVCEECYDREHAMRKVYKNE